MSIVIKGTKIYPSEVMEIGANLLVSRTADGVTLLEASGTVSLDWSAITGKPATFPPDAHAIESATHTTSGRTAGQVLRATAATTFGWSTTIWPNAVANGAVLYGTSTNNVGTIAIGGVGTVLRSTGTAPAWATLVKADLPSTIAYEDEQNTFSQRVQVTGNYLVHGTRLLSTDGTEANYVFQEHSSGSNYTLSSRGTSAPVLSIAYSTGVVTAPVYFVSGNGFYTVAATSSGFNEAAGAGIFSVRAGGVDSRLTVNSLGEVTAQSSIRTLGQFQMNTGAAFVLDKDTHGHTYIYEAINDRIDFVTGGGTALQLLVSSATFNGSVLANYVRAGQSTNGAITMQTGNGVSSGYIEWLRPTDAVRLAYMGFTPAGGALNLTLEDATHLILNKDLVVGTLGRFDSADTPTDREMMVYSSATGKWAAETIQFTFGNSDIKNTVLANNWTATYILVDPGVGADSPAGAPAAPVVKLYPAHKSMTVYLAGDLAGTSYTKPADFRYFRVLISTDVAFGTYQQIDSTSDKVVFGRLTNGVTYYVLGYVIDRAGNPSTAGAMQFAQPLDSETSAFGVILASEIGVVSLSAISGSIGHIQTGQISNVANTAGFFVDVWPGASVVPGTWTRYISLVGSGSDKFIMHENFELRHDGLARLKSRMSWVATQPIAASIAEETYSNHTHTIPASYEGIKGGLHIVAYFVVDPNVSGGTATFRVKLGGSTITSKVINVLTGGVREGRVDLYVFNQHANNSQRMNVIWTVNDGTTTVQHQSSVSAVDTTAAHNVTFTVQHSHINTTSYLMMSLVDILPKD
jgi:hypothetical protein